MKASELADLLNNEIDNGNDPEVHILLEAPGQPPLQPIEYVGLYDGAFVLCDHAPVEDDAADE